MTAIRPIPVLLTVRTLHIGGIERDVAKLAIALDGSRFRPYVASYCADGFRYDDLMRAGVPVLHLPTNSVLSRGGLKAAVLLRRHIRQHGIRVLHAFDGTAALAVPIARMMGLSAVLTSRLGYRDLLDKHTVQTLRITDRLADRVIVNCLALRRHMTDDEHLPAKRVLVCYGGVDLQEFHPGVSHVGTPDTPFVIGSVCVLRPEKCIHILQDAFAHVRHFRPCMKLVIVGSGPESPHLRENCDQLKLGDACVFVPATANVASWMRGMDIFALPSRSEGLSNALLEAMACGCATVGTNVGGTPELLGNNDRGLLCRPDDLADLINKLTRLIVDDSLRRALATRAAEFARAQLSIERTAEQMAAIYVNCLNGTPDTLG